MLCEMIFLANYLFVLNKIFEGMSLQACFIWNSSSSNSGTSYTSKTCLTKSLFCIIGDRKKQIKYHKCGSRFLKKKSYSYLKLLVSFKRNTALHPSSSDGIICHGSTAINKTAPTVHEQPWLCSRWPGYHTMGMAVILKWDGRLSGI